MLAIRPRDPCTVRAWIEDAEGQMRFTTDQRYAAMTRGAPFHVDLRLKSIVAPALR